MFQLCGCEFYEVLWRDAVFQNTRRHILDEVLYFYFQAQIVTRNDINVTSRGRTRSKNLGSSSRRSVTVRFCTSYYLQRTETHRTKIFHDEAFKALKSYLKTCTALLGGTVLSKFADMHK